MARLDGPRNEVVLGNRNGMAGRGGGGGARMPGGFNPANNGVSITRGPGAVVGHTGPALYSITTGITGAVQTLVVIDEFEWDRLVLGCATATLSDLALASLNHINDPLISGFVSFDLFAADSLYSPAFGRLVQVGDSLNYTVNNQNAGTLTVLASLSATQTARPRDRDLRPRWNQGGGFVASSGPGRSLVAFGPAASQSVAAAASASFAFSPAESCFLDRLILPRVTNSGQITVTQVLVNNKNVLPGGFGTGDVFRCDNPRNPRFGHFLTTRDTVTVAITNNSAATARILPSFSTF
jgi:hypothetical protein